MSASQKEIHFSLARIYFTAYSSNRTNFKRKQFRGLPYQGKDMLHNIFKMYIDQDPILSKEYLFSEKYQDQPLCQFIQNYLQLLFLPVLQQFSDFFDKSIMPLYSEDPKEFFDNIQIPVLSQFVPFINNLPSDFTNIFSEFYELLLQRKTQVKDDISPLAPLKNLFFLNNYLKALMNPSMVKNQEYIKALNMFKLILYKKSQYNFDSFKVMSEKCIAAFESMVTNWDTNNQNADIYNFYITDPILRHDYNFLANILKIIKFESIEEKDYEIVNYKSQLPERNRDKISNLDMNISGINQENTSYFNSNQQHESQNQELSQQEQKKMVQLRNIETPKFPIEQKPKLSDENIYKEQLQQALNQKKMLEQYHNEILQQKESELQKYKALINQSAGDQIESQMDKFKQEEQQLYEQQERDKVWGKQNKENDEFYNLSKRLKDKQKEEEKILDNIQNVKRKN
ncbi:hypothetical protein PPERSA_03726 [Pseudocohnilembus persalinus]|uniref:Uncharacterized protein n=1 Tax=Pseudocohnilembus persalinus TaxID=266149 RepID=A0A0V0QHQ0_PSEPJ|nr:hypothetical protein PPERSA_03726 [Pseudocohnilembus persalinus]|eukprot:KRX01642.1 hypothetical protein PPERSA_03726 [Pseudocohnilembus persalinus]